MSMNGVCGDFVYNYTNGAFSINQLPILLHATSATNILTATAAFGLGPHAFSNIACAIETHTGLPSPAGELLTVAGAFAVGKGLTYGLERYKVKTPAELIHAILVDKGFPMLTPEYQELAKKFEGVLKYKIEAMLQDLRTRFPNVFNIMTEEQKRNYAKEVKEQAMKALPAQIEENKERITAAVEHSRIPAQAQTRGAAMPGMQEGIFNTGAFNLEQALASILYGVNAVTTHAAPRPL